MFGIISQLFLLVHVLILLILSRLSNSASSGGRRQSSGDLKMVKLQKAQVRHLFWQIFFKKKKLI